MPELRLLVDGGGGGLERNGVDHVGLETGLQGPTEPLLAAQLLSPPDRVRLDSESSQTAHEHVDTRSVDGLVEVEPVERPEVP